MQDCVFCRIIHKKVPASFLYEDEHVLGIADAMPQAPFHALILPKIHIQSVLDCHREDDAIWVSIRDAIRGLSKKHQLDEGFRCVINTGSDGGQTVGHLHIHLLAGRALHWPPG